MSITINDVHNAIFNRYDEPSRQIYIDYANNEVEDLAKRFSVAVADIVTPWHFKLVEHAVNVALMKFGLGHAGFNNAGGFTDVDGDIYAQLYIRHKIQSQASHNKVSKVMFTGNDEDNKSRAVASAVLYRG